jgi:hypothetical protein
MPRSTHHPCAFTDKRAGFGERREDGECNMTKQYYGEAVDGGAFTTCERCHAYMCVVCLEKIASTMEKVEHGGRTILTHEVWTALTPCQNFSALGNIFPHFESSRKNSAFERFHAICARCSLAVADHIV